MTTASDCIVWTRCKNRAGYGIVGSGAFKSRLAHRVAWELAHGLVPDGMHVLHKCDVPACVNVDHLFLGTHADNMADMKKKGRQNPGPGKKWTKENPAPKWQGKSRSPFSILRIEDVQSIRTDARSQRKIATDFKVSQSTVWLIKHGRRWAWLPPAI